MFKRCFATFIVSSFAICSTVEAGKIAYIYGDVADNGNVPSGNADAYDQMLLTDSGSTGLSQFKFLVESQGHSIVQYYDQAISLTSSFLNGVDVVIFGLHQKMWSNAEKDSLDSWLRNGGGMFIYSDSASGGRFSMVGAQNSVGQSVTNNLIAQYGMEVTVDQAAGTTAYRSSPSPSNSLMSGRPILEGEGVSPIAVRSGSGVEILIPYRNDAANKVSGNASLRHLQNLTISNPSFAALALKRRGKGSVIAMFDRQPMWNSGPGSDINKRNNKEILRRVMNFLAASEATVPPVTLPSNPNSNATNNGALLLLLD